jgi:pyruvate dehydrogenase E2 component (dihydrolipoamide acetyltransferase)
MSIEVRLPELGGAGRARVSVWLKKEGERVSRGEVIAEVETDKTSVEIEAPRDGILARICIAAGTEDVAVDDLLAFVEPSANDAVEEPAAGPQAAAVLLAPHVPPTGQIPVTTPAPQSAVGESPVCPPVHPPTTRGKDEAHLAASPLARRMAYTARIPLSTIRGSGRGGRIMKEDVEALLCAQPGPAAARVAPPAVSVAAARLPDDDPATFEVVRLSTMRRVSAERLTSSKQTVPHFYLRAECAVDSVSRMRTEMNARLSDKLSLTAFVIRAVALALKKVPAANAMWADGAIRLYRQVDLAVAVNTPAGLVAPVIRKADEKSVAVLNGEMREVAERARAGRLRPEDYTGGTCTISNLGMFGVTSLYPIVNPPQACILGIGAVEERPVVRDHQIATGMMMTATLSADHRAVDGASGAEFLGAFRELVEDPWLLLL